MFGGVVVIGFDVLCLVVKCDGFGILNVCIVDWDWCDVIVKIKGVF